MSRPLDDPSQSERGLLSLNVSSNKLIGAALFLIALLAYAPSLGTGFVWDSYLMYVDDPSTSDIGDLTNIFSSQAIEHAKIEKISNLEYFRPLTKAYVIISRAVFGDEQQGFKLVSLLLHGIVVLLAFHLVFSICQDQFTAGIAALLFAVNPIHSEAVVWAYSVSYLLAAAFSLSTLILYRRGQYWFALTTFAAALLSHEIGVLVFPILMLHKWLLEESKSWMEFASLGPFAILLILFLGWRSLVVGPVPFTDVGLLPFFNTAAVVAARYLKMLFWPDSAVTVYLSEVFPALSLQVIGAYAVCIASLVLAIVFLRRDRQSLFWLLWFGVWISVSFNFGQMGEYLMAEKLVYTASIGIFVLVARAANRFLHGRHNWLFVVISIIVGLQIYATWNRISYWRDTTTYLHAALDYAPHFDLALYALGMQAINDKKYDDAQHFLLRLAESRPDYSPGLNNLANTYYVQGNRHQAIAYWKRAVNVDPTSPRPYFNIGMALYELRQKEESRIYFEQYLEREPNPPESVRLRLRSYGLQ